MSIDHNRRSTTMMRQVALSMALVVCIILSGCTMSASPARQYPKWLYKDEKIRALKHEMLELVTNRVQGVGV